MKQDRGSRERGVDECSKVVVHARQTLGLVLISLAVLARAHEVASEAEGDGAAAEIAADVVADLYTHSSNWPQYARNDAR